MGKIIPMEDAIGFSLTPSPDIAELLEMQNAEPDGLESFERTIVGALEAMANTLDMNIDNPIGKNLVPVPIIDPTVVISTAMDQIAASIESIMENIEDAVADAKDELGEDLQSFLDSLSEVFSFEMPGVTEVIEKLVIAMAYASALNIDGLFGVFGIPTISEIMDSLKTKINELMVKITTLDLAEDVISSIVEKLQNLSSTFTGITLENITSAVVEKITQLLAPVEISTVFLPPWVYDLLETTEDMFNIDLSWSDFFNLSLMDPPPITLQLYNIFIEIMGWFNSLFQDISAFSLFMLDLIASLTQGVPGLVEFLMETVVGWIAAALGLTSSAIFKIAASMALINRTVRYLAVCLVGKVIGKGLIFEAVAEELLG